MRWMLLVICSLFLITGCGQKQEPIDDSIVVSYDYAEKEENVESLEETKDNEYEEGDEISIDFEEESGEMNIESDDDEVATNNTKGYYTAEDYLANPSLFVPKWKGTWNPPKELLNFEKKWEAFFQPNGRLMSMAHRGDNDIYYPEDSIEGIMSCIAAGVDMLELDIRTTADGVHVMMHDATVTRTTNVNALRKSGVTGLPSSDYISDWTFEQLRQLRLVYESKNGNVVTNYVIPTYEDVVMTCANKVFVMLDIKSTEFEWERDAYPIVKKYNAYRSVWLPWSYSNSLPASEVNRLLNIIEKDSGYKAAFQCGVDASNVEKMVQMIRDYNLPMALRAKDYAPSFDKTLAPYFGKYRIHTNATRSPYNTLDSWKKLHAKGYNFIQVDDYMTLVRYIADQM